MSDDRYLQPAYAARYLEAEWGDLLLRHGHFPQGHSIPFAFQTDGVGFYAQVVSLIQRQLAQQPDFTPLRIADFGCATGRLVRELCHAIPSALTIQGFEPSVQLCGLATQMVAGVALPTYLPIVDQPTGSLRELEVTEALRVALQPNQATKRAQFSVATAESATVPSKQFDLVTCLNVLDRHPEPERLVQALGAGLREGGWLCISSPLDWQEESTPRAHWRDSVTDFLAPTDYQILAHEDIDYHFRLSRRRRIHYASQVVLAQRRS